jgi:hypothetical protein
MRTTFLNLHFYTGKRRGSIAGHRKVHEKPKKKLKKETEGKREKRKVPGSAIRRLMEELERCGGENGCMLKERLLSLHGEVFGYKSEKPLYGVIKRAIERRKAYTIRTREGVMICSMRVHERKLLSILEDIYLSRRPNPIKKFKDEIPDVDRERYLIYAIQHLLSYEEISSIVRPDYRLISNAMKLGDTRLLQEAKRRLSLRDLREAIRFYEDAIQKIVTLKAKTIAPQPELVEWIAEKLRSVVSSIKDVNTFDMVVREAAEDIMRTYKLPAERLPQIVGALKEIFDLVRILGDVYEFLHEIKNNHERMYRELKSTSFNVIKRALEEGELKGECSLCGKPVHDDFEIDLLGEVILLPPNRFVII